MSSTAEHLRRVMRESIVLTELQHMTLMLRLMTALLAGAMLADLIDPALLLMHTPESLVFRAATATKMGPQALALLFLALAVLLAPFFALQLGMLAARRRGITQLACLSLALTGVVWAFLAWRAVPLDLGAAPVVFARHGAAALLFALVLAWSLNAEQVRTLLERS